MHALVQPQYPSHWQHCNMAAQLIMPTLPSEQHHSRHFLPAHRPTHHARSQSYNLAGAGPRFQINTDLTNKNDGHYASTPPSPRGTSGSRSNIHSKGARPLYMPAVLRPNYEFPPAQPLSRSPGASSDSGSDSTLRRTNTANLLSLTGLGAIGYRLSRRSTIDSSKSLEGEWDLATYPDVMSAPTRKHWKPDTESTVCDDPLCKRTFTYFTRRHHCRKCGNIFCDSHSASVLPLDQDANFNPRADPSRTCNHCFEQVKARHSRNNSQSSGSDSTGAGATARGATAIAARKGGADNEFNLPSSKDLAASVPRDWNWSTF
ncbi:FYVE domain protein, putative [Cordyceps militaris CM01]|uniref:FYVE domain protein, putative n=1 Tax=Cordyceps militaris (strain CM01) TaxID=983644 RepID=G3JHE7_CORMM|nr:FYVE domain protein, putative [Cordyceps militaris CM01]EGX91703.1 FYVE domain protein, putative [Cordyceps militaris CM01]